MASFPKRTALLCAAALGVAAHLASVPEASADLKGFLKKSVKDLGKKREAREKTGGKKAHAAVRGLGEDEDASAEQGRRDYAGLDWLESVEISEEELDAFIAEGHLAATGTQ